MTVLGSSVGIAPARAGCTGLTMREANICSGHAGSNETSQLISDLALSGGIVAAQKTAMAPMTATLRTLAIVHFLKD